MKHSKALALILGAVLTLSALFGCGDSTAKKAGGSPLDLDSFEAATLDGKTFTQKDFAGKDVTIVNFWGTFCTPCIQEMPELGELAGELPDNVQFISICVDGASAPADAKQLMDQTGFQVTTLVSGNEAFESVLSQVQAVPTTIFVDEKGCLIGDGHSMEDVFEENPEKIEPEMGIIEGSSPDGMKKVYQRAVNKALKYLGKEEISFE